MNQRDKQIMDKVNFETLKNTNMILVSRPKYRLYQFVFMMMMLLMLIIIFSIGVFALSPDSIKDKLLTIVLKIELSNDSFNMVTDYIDLKIDQINSIPISP